MHVSASMPKSAQEQPRAAADIWLSFADDAVSTRGNPAFSRALEAQMRPHFPAFSFEHERAFQPLKSGFGVLVAERRGLFIIAFGGIAVLWSAPPGFGKIAHPIQCSGMTLRCRFFEHGARADIVLRTPDPIGHHQAELKLRFGGIRFRGFNKERSRRGGIG